MPMCVVKGCRSRQAGGWAKRQLKNGLAFFCFPAEDSCLFEKWQDVCSFPDGKPFPDNPVICSNHFREADIVRVSPSKIKLKPGSLPYRQPSQKQVLEYINHLRANTTEPYFTKRPLSEEDKQLSVDEVIEVYKSAASSPWSWLQNDRIFLFFKSEISPIDSPHVSDVLTVDKGSGQTSLTRKGEPICLTYLLPPCHFENGAIKATARSIKALVATLKKNRQVDTSAEDLLSSQAVIAKQLSRKVGDVKKRETFSFLAHQMAMVAGVEKEPDDLATKLALIVQKCSPTAWQALKTCNLVNFGKDSLSYFPEWLNPSTARLSKLHQVAIHMCIYNLAPGYSFDPQGQIVGRATNTQESDEPLLATKLMVFVAESLEHLKGELRRRYHLVSIYPVAWPVSTEFMSQTVNQTLQDLSVSGITVTALLMTPSCSNLKLQRFLTKREGGDTSVPFIQGTEIVTYCHIPEIIDMLKEQFYLQMKSFPQQTTVNLHPSELFSQEYAEQLSQRVSEQSILVFHRHCTDFAKLIYSQEDFLDLKSLSRVNTFFQQSGTHVSSLVCNTLNAIAHMSGNQATPLKLPFLEQAEVNTLIEDCTQFHVINRPGKKTKNSPVGNSSIMLVPLWSKGRLPLSITHQALPERGKKRKCSNYMVHINPNHVAKEFAFPNFDVDNKVRQLFIEEETNLA